MGRCLSCWGELKIIGAILEQSVIKKILTHLVVCRRGRQSVARRC